MSVYFMGRIYEEPGEKEKAKEWFYRARDLYEKFGWVYEGLKERV